MMRMQFGLGVALSLAMFCVVGAARAQDDVVSLEIKDAPLGEAIKILSAETNIQFILGPGVDDQQRITISVSNQPVERALNLLLTAAGNLKAEKVDGVYIIQAADAGAAPGPGGMPRPGTGTVPARPTAPTRPGSMPGPRPPAGTSTTTPGMGGETGAPTVSSKRYEKINLIYAYAPGLAEALGGEPLLYSDIDPWAGSVGTSGGGGGIGGGGGGGFGGGGGGGGFGGGGGGSSFGGGGGSSFGGGGGGSSFGGGGGGSSFGGGGGF